MNNISFIIALHTTLHPVRDTIPVERELKLGGIPLWHWCSAVGEAGRRTPVRWRRVGIFEVSEVGIIFSRCL